MKARRRMGPLILVARRVGEMLLDEQSSAKKVAVSAHDFVTNLDHEAERIAGEMLRTYFGNKIAIYGEEGGGKIPKIGLAAIIDGIDATTNFFHCDYFWSHSIGLIENGAYFMAAFVMPETNQVFSAHRDLATATVREMAETKNRTKKVSLRVSPTKILKGSRVWTDWSKGDPELTLKILRALNDTTTLPQVRVCCAPSMMQLAMSKIDGYVQPAPSPEDTAAATLIVRKAGGMVTNIDGDPWTPFSSGVMVASNGSIHNELLETVQIGLK